jgi:AraC-like DNA-binding protein
MSTSAECRRVHFSTHTTPERDRLELWREVIGRSVLRLDVNPLPDTEFSVDVTLQAMPGLATLAGMFCGSRSGRTRALLADGVDDIALAVNVAGPYHVLQGKRELTLNDGDATLFSCGDPSSFTRREAGRVVALRMPRARLAALVDNVEDAFVRPLPRGSQTLQLLTGYLRVVQDEITVASPKLRALIVSHVHDLVALTLGATPDAAEIARDRGLRAARLSAVKADIAARLGAGDLSVAAVAARQKVTPRYVQMLFESEGTTFSEFVLGERLARALRLLTDPRQAHRNISTIAYAVGFNDLSYFNRCFRRRFGDTPSAVRASLDAGSCPAPLSPDKSRAPRAPRLTHS